MAAHKEGTFDYSHCDKVVTPSNSVRHSYGDVDKFFTPGHRNELEFSKNSTDFPSAMTLSTLNHNIKMKKRLKQQQNKPTEIVELEDIEMKVMQT